MKHMNWSYQDLLNAPYDLVDEIFWKIHFENKWKRAQNSLQEQVDKSKKGK